MRTRDEHHCSSEGKLGDEAKNGVFLTQSTTEVATWPDYAFTNVLSACMLTLSKAHPVCPVKHRGVFEPVSRTSLAFPLSAVHKVVLNVKLLLLPLIYLCIIS